MRGKTSNAFLIVFLLILGCLFIPAFSTAVTDQKGIPLKPGDTTGLIPVHLIKVDASIKNATPDWLTLVADPKDRDLLLTYIDNSSASQADKQFHKDSLKILWEKYPLEYRDEGNTTHISFKNKNSAQVLTSAENITMMKIASLISEGGYATYAGQETVIKEIPEESSPKVPFTPIITTAPPSSKKKSDDVTSEGPVLQWESETCHGHLIFIPLCKISTWDYANRAANAADDPDVWDSQPFPWPIPSEFTDIVHGIRHYYNPDTSMGTAPSNAQSHGIRARSEYQAGNINYASSWVGWSSHYLADVANPMHTGQEIAQARDRGLHSSYENYVYVKWDPYYAPILWDDPYYYPMTSPNDWTIYSAQMSHVYLDTLLQRVQVHRDVDGLHNDPIVRDITTNNLLLAERMCWGLASFVGF